MSNFWQSTLIGNYGVSSLIMSLPLCGTLVCAIQPSPQHHQTDPNLRKPEGQQGWITEHAQSLQLFPSFSWRPVAHTQQSIPNYKLRVTLDFPVDGDEQPGTWGRKSNSGYMCSTLPPKARMSPTNPHPHPPKISPSNSELTSLSKSSSTGRETAVETMRGADIPAHGRRRTQVSFWNQ